jgi:hypothetical protein
MSTEKDIAIQILAKNEVAADFGKLKNTGIGILFSILEWAEKIAGEITDEKQFLKIVAELIDAAFKPSTGNPALDAGLEFADGFIALKILELADGQLLDRFIGKDWFAKLKEQLAIKKKQQLKDGLDAHTMKDGVV